MASEVSVENRNSKRIKLSADNNEAVFDPKAENLSAHSRITSFDGFKVNQILSDNARSKSLFVEGAFEDSDESAIVLLEKMPIAKDSINKVLNYADLALNLVSNPVEKSNVINYAFYPKVDKLDFKATIICPATPKHIEKYLFQPFNVVNETAEAYQNIVLPHILSQNFSIQWVYNILNHTSEADRIVFEDPNKETGFVLLPDLKWDENEEGSLYLIAICHNKTIKSLRDLDSSHLPLLRNVKAKSLDAISKRYHISPELLRIYIHYQPSYYHLHVHFTSVNKLMPGTQFEKAHLLDTVIGNIEICDSYYQKATLTYTMKQTDPLCEKLKEASVIRVLPTE